jgi:uncharacterized protein (DUF952 family)
MYIYHITSKKDWLAGKTVGSYRASSLETEGFIHGSQRDQVVDSAERYFHGRTDLLLLIIQSGVLIPPLRLEGEQLWPHIYGPLNLEAVESVVEFPLSTDGKFRLPPGV